MFLTPGVDAHCREGSLQDSSGLPAGDLSPSRLQCLGELQEHRRGSELLSQVSSNDRVQECRGQ